MQTQTQKQTRQMVLSLIDETLVEFLIKDAERCDEPDPCPFTGEPKKKVGKAWCDRCMDVSCDRNPVNKPKH